jgi:glucosamine-6-phosphate deaminase
MKIIDTKDYSDLCRKAANVISAQIILHSDSVLGLATGKTPVGVYAQLVDWYNKNDLDFSEVRTVNLDEYCGLGPEDETSYRYFMNRNLFDKINIKKENTHVPNGLAKDFDAECQRYDELIKSLGGIDLQLLGIGHNGHIGFNEPGMDFEKMTHCIELTEQTRQSNSKYFPSMEAVPRKAVTMGIRAIMQAEKILLIADGESKREILKTALYGPVTPSVPASILQLHPNLTVVTSCRIS